MKRRQRLPTMLVTTCALAVASATAQEASRARHWAFESLPPSVAVPVIESAWPRTDLDRFVLRAMRAQGLEPAAEAPRWRWLRRVSLDLIGLPPTAAAVAAFEADAREDAYERVVDALLEQPQFGERRATPWLDVARYADSYGYQSDLLMPTWPYRDWVVRAFNANRGFDVFARDQLAGDLLPDAKRDEKLATAFQRLHRMTNEGGSIAAELRTEYAADRVATFGTAFLGLTLDCARCHDHKFDPISQREYYSLFSYFNSIGEHGLYHDSARVPTPSLLLPDEKQEAQLAELEARVRVADQDLEAALAAAEKRDAMARTRTTLEELQQRIEVEAGAGLVGHFPMEGPSGDAASARELANLVPGRKPGKTSAGNRYCAGKVGQALEFSGDDVASFPELCGALHLDEAFTIAFWYRHAGQVDKAVVLHRSSGTDVGYFGTELSLDKGRLRFAMQRHAPSNAMAVVTRTALRQDTWVHVAITYDASHRARGLRIYLDGRLASEVERDTLTKRPQHGGSGFDFGQRFRDRGPRGDAVDEVRAYERALSGAEVAALAGTLATDARGLDDRSLADFFVDRDAEVTAARARVTAAQRALFELRTGFQEISVMAEAAPREATHVLARGAYDAPRDEASRVARAVPACIAGDVGQDAKAIDDRLALARWLLRDDHPLFARVVVNRFWQDFFGRGIVATADDFGTRGTPPTHPDLLDWLARDFVASGYDVKRLCRSIVLSATYRQDSRARAATRERDADNVWLARYPARRLSAEELRDSALAVAGLLDRSVGGPPVSPYQPKGLWRESNSMSPAYQQSVGTALYRRSLYSVWKRTAPLPNMLLFDAAHRESCVARRGETSTPLQALVLLNDVQFVEAARVFAQSGLAAPSGPDLVEGGANDVTAWLRRAVSEVTCRAAFEEALEEEVVTLRQLYDEALRHFQSEPAAAAAFVRVGAFAFPDQLDAVEVAARTAVVQVLLNSDAFTWKR